MPRRQITDFNPSREPVVQRIDVVDAAEFDYLAAMAVEARELLDLPMLDNPGWQIRRKKFIAHVDAIVAVSAYQKDMENGKATQEG